MYRALQALLCLLCLSSVLTVWASVNAPREASWGETFDDTTSQGTAAAAISMSFTEVPVGKMSSSTQCAVATPVHPPIATPMVGNDEHPTVKDF